MILKQLLVLVGAFYSATAIHDNPQVTCRVKLEWHTTQISPEHKYRLAAKGRDGKFYQMKNIIGRDKATSLKAGKTTFVVPMWRFLQKPFELKDRDVIEVIVSAKLADGWGPYLKVVKPDVAPTVYAPPLGAENLRAEMVASASLLLAWEAIPGGRAAEKYQVFMSEGPSRPYKALGTTQKTSLFVDGLTDGATYLFKVRAINLCGHSDSDAVFVTVGVAPIAAAGSITTKNCNAEIRWNTLETDVTTEVMIKNSAGKHQPVRQCGAAGTKTCSFHLSALTLAPFELPQGAKLEGQMRTCKKGICGDYVALNSDAVLMTSPPEAAEAGVFEQLVWTNYDTPPLENVQLSWANFVRQYTPTGEFYYRLDVCAGEGNCAADSPEWKTLTKTTKDRAAVAWLEGVDRYRFRVTACNECGCSKSCEPLTIVRPRPPHPCQCPHISVKQCSWMNKLNIRKPRTVTVEWGRPHDDGGAPIERYTLEIADKDGVWVKVNTAKACPGLRVGRVMKCTFKMSLLETAAYGLEVGSRINARVSAHNLVGQGLAVHQDQCGKRTPVRVLEAPPVLPAPTIKQETTYIEVCWEKCEGCSGYTVAWAATGNALRTRQSVPIDDPNKTCQNIQGLYAGVPYKVCVRAGDSCKESCVPYKLADPPPPPVCVIGICGPEIKLTCSCSAHGAEPVTGYQVDVMNKYAQFQWTDFGDCGSNGGADLKCMISHQWLKDKTDHQEGDPVVVRVRAQNRFGWSMHSKLLKTSIVSKPKAITPLKLSANGSMLSWSSCQAAQCKYDVKALSPSTSLLAIGVTDYFYKLPAYDQGVSQQYEVVGFNQCGSTVACLPVLAPPLFKESCPTIATWSPLDDKCSVKKEEPKCTTLELQCLHAFTQMWITVPGCSGPEQQCNIKELDFLKSHGLEAGQTAQCRMKACDVVSKTTLYKVEVPDPHVLVTPNMGWYEGAIVVDWIQPEASLFCDIKGPNQFVQIKALSDDKISTAFHAKCGVPYTCYLAQKNTCGLEPSMSPKAVLTEPCPPVFTPVCNMQPKCKEDAMGNSADYVSFECSSPDPSLGVILEEYKLEIKTSSQYASGDALWVELECGAENSAPNCDIPMEELAQSPYNLKHGAQVHARVTATAKRDGKAVPSRCQGEVQLALPPQGVALTATQDSYRARVCWNSPFVHGKTENDSFMLYWDKSSDVTTDMQASSFTNKLEVTDMDGNCKDIGITSDTTFLAVAATKCPSRQATIKVELTDCPECHHAEHFVHQDIKVEGAPHSSEKQNEADHGHK